MSNRLEIAWRWAIHHGAMIGGFFCWAFYMIWPSWRGGWWNRVGSFFLPAAGYYAYGDDPWARKNTAHWIKTGNWLAADAGDGDVF